MQLGNPPVPGPAAGGSPPWPGAASPPPLDRLEPVLLIHGTFANTMQSGQVDWWRPGSAFCGQFDRLLAGHGSPARCWSQLKPGIGATPGASPFAWTGANLESDRLRAGEALAAQLVALESDPRVARYHLVGHSHGGNVILNAFAHPLYRPAKLASVVYLGTPVLRFHHLDRAVERWSSLAVSLGALGAGGWGWPRWPDQQVYLVLLVAAALLGLVFGVRGLRDADLGRPVGGGRHHAFMFNNDEAFAALASAQGVLQRTTAFLMQWLKSEPAPAFAVAPTVAALSTLQARVAAMGPSLAADAFERAEVPASAAIGGLAWRPPGAAPPDPLAGPMSWVVTAFRSLPLGNLLPTVLRGLAWVAMAVRALVFVLVRLGVGFAARLLAMGMLGVMFCLLWMSLPWFIRRSAFGEDRGTFRAVSALPPGVANLEPISAALEAEALAVGEGLSHRAGAGVFAGLVQRDPLAIRSTVKDALTNSALVHSHYYRSNEIIERTAGLIAGAQASRP